MAYLQPSLYTNVENNLNIPNITLCEYCKFCRYKYVYLALSLQRNPFENGTRYWYELFLQLYLPMYCIHFGRQELLYNFGFMCGEEEEKTSSENYYVKNYLLGKTILDFKWKSNCQ